MNQWGIIGIVMSCPEILNILSRYDKKKKQNITMNGRPFSASAIYSVAALVKHRVAVGCIQWVLPVNGGMEG